VQRKVAGKTLQTFNDVDERNSRRGGDTVPSRRTPCIRTAFRRHPQLRVDGKRRSSAWTRTWRASIDRRSVRMRIPFSPEQLTESDRECFPQRLTDSYIRPIAYMERKHWHRAQCSTETAILAWPQMATSASRAGCWSEADLSISKIRCAHDADHRQSLRQYLNSRLPR